jgi:hypothetical protein
MISILGWIYIFNVLRQDIRIWTSFHVQYGQFKRKSFILG